MNKALADERGAETPGGIALIKRTIDPLAKAIENAVAEMETGKPGRRAVALKYLKDFPADVAAYLTIKVVVSAAMRQAPLTSTATAVGAAIQDELRLAAFEDEKPGLYKLIDRRLKERGAAPDHSMTVFVYTANKFEMDLPKMSPGERVNLGMKLIDLFIQTTGFAEIHTYRKKGRKYRTQAIIRHTDKVSEWITDRNIRAEFLRPYYLPTVIPPRPWTGLFNGGYHTGALSALPLVKNVSKAQLKLLEQADLSVVLEGINAIQDTPWRINTRILDIMQSVWDRGVEIAMPQREDKPLPAKPIDIDSNLVALREWKNDARSVYENNAKTKAKRLAIEMMLSAADDLRNDPEIYFPHQLDFRGRAYAIPIALNPQGPDHSRALLSLAKGDPIDTPRAAGWLAIQGANLWGYDKVNFEDRIGWVEERHDRILATAKDPFSDLWWTEADGGKTAWQFLSWIFDYAGFLTQGYGYVSSFVIYQDGSCNGLQHFSAMLRDAVGGCAVNLIPSDKPNDIYQTVADRVNERLEGGEYEAGWMADLWKRFGITRKITKRPVMVLPYGGTYRSCFEYVREAVQKEITSGKENPFGGQLHEATSLLSSTVWKSIADVVVAARSAMDWLQQVARVATKHGITLHWTTPSGFVAYQGYREIRSHRVKTRLQGSIVYTASIEAEGSRLDSRRQQLGISPNFVHSMDAAAMMLTIALARHNGVTQFAMVHDSYGTTAAKMDMLSQCIREAFADMYLEHDVLEEFLRQLPPEVQAECPPIPPKGTLDIEAVRKSDFFFA